MAYAQLMHQAGEGDSLNADGVIASERFHVTLDFYTDDFVDVLQNRLINDPYGRTGVPPGTSHPKTNWAKAKVTQYDLAQRLDDLNVEALVIYNTEEELGEFNGWEHTFRFQSRTESTGRDANGELIGVPWFRLAKDTETSEIQARARNPETGKVIGLIPVNNLDETPAVRRQPFDKIVIDGLLTFRRRIGRWTFARARNMTFYGGKVNSESWNGFLKDTLMFVDFDMSQVATIGSEAAPGSAIEYDVTVVFAYNAKGHNPLELAPTYTDTETGVDLVITKDGSNEPIIVEFEPYERVGFTKIFAALGVIAPTDRGR